MTVEERLAEWASQAPGLHVTDAECQFLADMRTARNLGVGYGWMQQVIEWEWNATCPEGGWGPEWFGRQEAIAEARIAEAEANRDKLLAALREVLDWSLSAIDAGIEDDNGREELVRHAQAEHRIPKLLRSLIAEAEGNADVG